jgi:acyl carrier protein
VNEEELTKVITGIWRDTLGCAHPAAGQHFFTDLGGNSLLAFQATARLREAVGARIPLKLLFANATFARYVAAVREQLLAAGTVS